MAISRLNGKQIRPGVLTNQHVAANADIHESKLDVNWAGHYQSALETKKVIDFVQVGNKMVSEATEYNLTTSGVLLGGNVTTSTGTDEGVITDAPYNKVIIRDAVTGDAVLDAEGEEVYGRLVHDGVDFKVLFMSPGLDGESNPVEAPFTMPVDQEIDFQYMERFNLKTVSELFAANEKFVAGAADITAFQNIEQLAKDLYGAGYTLDRDGQGNLTASIQEQIKALEERSTNLEQGSNAEVDSAKDRDAASANGHFAVKEFATLEGRFVEIENFVDAEAKDKEDRVSALETEVSTARGSEDSLDVRLDRSLNENGTLKAGQLIHEHFRARFQAAGGEAEVLLSQFTSKKTLPAAFQVGDDSLEVYINGQLQEEGLNYQEAVTGDKITFDLGDGTVLEPTDIVQIKFHINNAE